jgi:hypothetical protein
MLISSFRSGNFEIFIYDSLSSDIVDKWNSMNSTSLNSGYLKFIEEIKPKDLEFRYVIVESLSNGMPEPCAILYFQLSKFTKRNINFYNSVLLRILSTIVLAIRPIRILVCGNIFAVTFPSIRYDYNKISTSDILEVLSEIGNREKSDVYFLKDMDKEFTFSETKKFRWSQYPSDLTMFLEIDRSWNSMDDYMNSLSKKYKKRAEKIKLAGKKMIRRDLDSNEIMQERKKIISLFNQVASKQTVRMGLIDADYFYEFKKRFKDSFIFCGYYMDEKLIAFSSFIDHDEILENHYIGIDYTYNKDLLIYFNILFDGVERAIELKKEKLELGRTAREAKANLGAIPEYFNDYVKINGRLLGKLTNTFTKYFQSQIGEQWKDRHPFKK